MQKKTESDKFEAIIDKRNIKHLVPEGATM